MMTFQIGIKRWIDKGVYEGIIMKKIEKAVDKENEKLLERDGNVWDLNVKDKIGLPYEEVEGSKYGELIEQGDLKCIYKIQ